jgi:hypothetical protein
MGDSTIKDAKRVAETLLKEQPRYPKLAESAFKEFGRKQPYDWTFLGNDGSYDLYAGVSLGDNPQRHVCIAGPDVTGEREFIVINRSESEWEADDDEYPIREALALIRAWELWRATPALMNFRGMGARLHTNTFRHRRVLVTMRDGSQFVDRFVEGGSGVIILKEHGRVRLKDVANWAPHRNIAPRAKE